MDGTPSAEEVRRWQGRVAELERQLTAIQHISEGLSALTRVEDTVREALELALQFAEADAGSLVLHDAEKDKLVYRYVIGEKAEQIAGLELAPDQGIAGQVFGRGESLISEDVSKVAAHLTAVDERTGYVTRNMVTVPLKSLSGDPIGVMQVLNKREGAFEESDVRLIEIMASEVAVAIVSARLAEEARLAEIVKFIGDISHDVKNMIAPVQTGAETLLIFAEDSFARLDEVAAGAGEELRQQLTEALGELRELLPEMVEMMQEGSEAVQQRMAEISAAVKGMVSEPHFEEADALEVAERVVNLLRVQAEKKGVALRLESPAEGCPPASVDKKQLYNAIYNLIFNALDACETGDEVVFRACCGPQQPWPEGNYLVLECADSGPGMPPEVKERLFTEHAVSTKPMGTGLGTKIVANVVKVHSGLIELESEPGQGTTIRLRLPIHQPPQ